MNASAILSSPIAPTPITNFSPISRRRRAATLRGSVQTTSFKSATAPVAGSFYEILRVDRTASFNEIKTAYRSLAKIYHPDVTGSSTGLSSSDGRDFIQIRNAYATLSDPMARAMYDMSLGQRGRRVKSRLYPTRRWETDQCW